MQNTLRTLLLNELDQRRGRNPLYSLRALSRDLNIGLGSLSEVISGKRDLSKKNQLKVFHHLNLTTEQKNIFLNNKTSKNDKTSEIHQLLLEDEFKLIADWYYLAILNLAKLKTNKADAGWISKRLNIEPYQSLEALERLQRLKLLKIEKNKLIRTSKPLTTSTEISSSAIRKHHSQNLHLAQNAIENVPVHLREFGSVTMSVNLKNLPKIKELLLKTRKKAADLLEDSQASEVYTLSFQLFPLTTIKGAK